MDNLLNFLADNYIWFLIGALILLFALIGFIVDGKNKAKKENAENGDIPQGDGTIFNGEPTNVSEGKKDDNDLTNIDVSQVASGLTLGQSIIDNANVGGNNAENATPAAQEPVANAEQPLQAPVTPEMPIVEQQPVQPEMVIEQPAQPEMVIEQPAQPESVPVENQVASIFDEPAAQDMTLGEPVSMTPEVLAEPATIGEPISMTPEAPVTPEVPQVPPIQ